MIILNSSNEGEAKDMMKDRFGIRLSFYAVLAFALAIFGQTLLCGLLLGFVIFVQQDQWLTRQVIQALFLCFVGSVFSVLNGLFTVLRYVPLLNMLVAGTGALIGGLLTLLVLIFALLGLIRVSRNEEAELPIAATLARKAFD